MEKKSGLVLIDPWLTPYNQALLYRAEATNNMLKSITDGKSLVDCTRDFEFFGLHKYNDNWIFREWAPAATSIYLLCEANNWKETPEYELHRKNDDIWELAMSIESLKHESLYKLHPFRQIF